MRYSLPMPVLVETVGVISDTHLQAASPELLALLGSLLGDCTRLLHAGDIVDRGVLDLLASRFGVEAVRGNMDMGPDLRDLPRKRLVRVGGLEVGLCHGAGSPGSIEQYLINQFAPSPPRVIVYGHTHRASDRTVEGVRLLNPGSPTDRRSAPLCTVGRLTVSGEDVRFEVIPI